MAIEIRSPAFGMPWRQTSRRYSMHWRGGQSASEARILAKSENHGKRLTMQSTSG